MKIVFTLFAAFCFTSAQAQLLIQTDMVPEPGENFASHVVTNATSLQPGNSGLSETWDLSTATYEPDTFNIKLSMVSSATPHAASFPTANLAIKSYDSFDPSHVAYHYYLLDTNLHYFYLGSKGGTVTQVYSDPLEQFHFPFGYNNTAYDAYCFESSSSSIAYDFCGTAMLRFDGVGTLMLPYGSFNNVYRLKLQRNYVNQSTSDTSFSVVYCWYKPGIHHALATYEIFTGSDGVEITTATILSQFITSTNEIAVDNKLDVYPNPFHQGVHINNISSVSNELLSVYSADGKLVHHEKVNANNTSIDLNHLPNGVYAITVNNGVATRKQIVVKQ